MTDYETYLVCDCGWHQRAPFGSAFHVHVTVCPDCGGSKDEMRTAVGRSVTPRPWWKFRAAEFVPKKVES